MAARGMLSNPAMFGGHLTTPQQCISDWVRIRGTQANVYFYYQYRWT